MLTDGSVFLDSPLSAEGVEQVASLVYSYTSLREHPFVSYIIRIGRALCKVTPAVSAWGLSPHNSPLSAEGVEQVPEPCDGIAHLGTRPVEP